MDQKLNRILTDIDAMNGVEGSAIVDFRSGMVIYTSPGFDDEATPLAEATSDYWRLYERQSGAFNALGPLKISIMIHEKKRLTMLPCGEGLMCLVQTAKVDDIDWLELQRKVLCLHNTFLNGPSAG